VHVVGGMYDYPRLHREPATAERAAQEARALEALRTDVPEEVRRVQDREEVVARGRTYREILRIARERKSDLIVMGVQGCGPIDRALFGSTAHEVVRRSTCPVLTVRPAAASARAEVERSEAAAAQTVAR
jgi:nucleotide-binding universal stress UspA family protein